MCMWNYEVYTFNKTCACFKTMFYSEFVDKLSYHNIILLILAPFNVVFEEDSYNVTEGETVTVCITIFSSPELDNATFDDVYAIVSLATSNDQPLEGSSTLYTLSYFTIIDD